MEQVQIDITTKQDISRLVAKFYAKVREDELLAPIFRHVDWDHHIPIIENFWSMILLGDPAYKGNPFVKHMDLPIRAQHFQQWILLFRQTVDENFSGDKATEAKMRAESIAGIFQHKLGLL